MRAGVFNRYWSSFGGGERHAARIAQVLVEDGWSVDLLGPEEVSLDAVGRHLALDLSGVAMRVVPERGDSHLAEVTAGYDLFVNASYMSRLSPRAKRNVYLCFFPTPVDHDLGPVQRVLLHRFGKRIAAHWQPFEYGTGWFPPEGGRRRTWAWTGGEALLILPPGTNPVIEADFARVGREGTVTLVVSDEAGHPWAEIPVGPAFVHHRVAVPAGGTGTVVRFSSPTFTPGAGDTRTLGVAVSRLRVGGKQTLAARVVNRFPWLLRDPANLEFLGSYDRILANSGYTRGWIRDLWRADAEILYPPIRLDPMPPAAQREPVIASVGRFFGPRFGHSKRQLEMVRAFGQLHRRGVLPGWRMRVLGGCEPSQESYLRDVQRTAAGLPVEVVANAPRAEVERLFATAAIFWSATGLGEAEQRKPWTSEHFGITTVEAMSGGCVPVVIDRAGQREIVRDGVDGFRWHNLAQLGERTRQLAGDRSLLARLGASARERATEFSESAFDLRWREIMSDLGLGQA
jgi:glycosyltransferase involved in cell wall biosynthesis